MYKLCYYLELPMIFKMLVDHESHQIFFFIFSNLETKSHLIQVFYSNLFSYFLYNLLLIYVAPSMQQLQYCYLKSIIYQSDMHIRVNLFRTKYKCIFNSKFMSKNDDKLRKKLMTQTCMSRCK